MEIEFNDARRVRLSSNLTVTETTNKFYCGANTRLTLRQYLNRSIDKRLQGEMPFMEEELDQAVAISFSVQQSREPLYSYADSEFSAMADGKVIVIGKLVTNISDESPSNYIAMVLRDMRRHVFHEATGKGGQVVEITEEERIKAKIASGASLTEQEISWYGEYVFRYQDRANTKLSQGRFNTNLIYRDGRADQHNMGFDLIIHTIGKAPAALNDFITNAPIEAVTLKDVTIRSVEQDRAPTDQPIVEVYDFVARTVIYGGN